VEDPQAARVEVLLRVRRPGQVAVGRVPRDRVDGEVAPQQVLLERRPELHLGQRARPRVALAPRAGQVEGVAAERHRGRAEALVLDDTSVDAPRDGHRVALHDEVELMRRTAEQNVADGAADHVHGVLARERLHGGMLGQRVHRRHLGAWLTCL
jgi:hypothetical protein